MQLGDQGPIGPISVLLYLGQIRMDVTSHEKKVQLTKYQNNLTHAQHGLVVALECGPIKTQSMICNVHSNPVHGLHDHTAHTTTVFVMNF